MKISIIFTNDYEVFGNGSGDVFETLISPTNKLLSKLDHYGVKQTIFADIVEYWRFKEAEENNYFEGDYQAATLIEKQLQQAVIDGHDVQLHVHPQWLSAEPLGKNNWKVNLNYWRTSKVPKGLGSTSDRLSLRGMLYEGKHTLESMLKPVKTDYECLAFRAGGYCIQPEEQVLQAMGEVGLKLESSVCPGRHLDRFPAYFDFRNAPSDLAYWSVSTSVNAPDENGKLMELPVATSKQARISLSWMRNKRILSIMRRVLMPQIVNLDYCKLNGYELIGMTEKYIENVGRRYENTNIPLPVVLIGHSKEWIEQDSLDPYLEWIKSHSDIKTETLFDWFVSWEKKEQ